MSQESWESYIELPDWRRKRWRFNYSKHITSEGWCLDWEVVAPSGSVRASGEKDIALAQRCLDESGLVDNWLLEYEFRWWVNHYTNAINIKQLRAIQISGGEE